MTQNTNGSLHAIIWKICRKAIFVERKNVETAMAIAACQFSMGATFKVTLCKTLGMEPGNNLIKEKKLGNQGKSGIGREGSHHRGIEKEETGGYYEIQISLRMDNRYFEGP